MASVWLARLHGKHGFEKLVAVKTILPQYASDARFQQMFLDEARIAAGIEHANVAQILDLGEQGEVFYLVMEWVDGDSVSKLHRAVRKRQATMPMGVVLRIMADTCAGLHAAHEMRDPSGTSLGVVHRDVSPQNILVSVNGAAKLIDFGIAKARDRLSGDTTAGLLKGKIQYMAPEQAIGKTVDRRADVWAIGAVMYYMLTGAPPYDGANQLATLHMLTSGDPPPPLPSTYPPELDALCQRALAFEPDDRIGSAAELHRALERLMIAMGCHTTSSDVATFVHEHLGERTEARRKAVEHALRASTERRRAASAGLTAENPAPPDVHLRETRPLRAIDRRSFTPTDADAPRAPDAWVVPPAPSLPSLPSARAATGGEDDAPVSLITAGTLGSAVIGFPNAAGPSSGAPSFHEVSLRARHFVAAAIGVLGAVVFVVVFALASFLLRQREPGRRAVLAAPPGVPVAPEVRDAQGARDAHDAQQAHETQESPSLAVAPLRGAELPDASEENKGGATATRTKAPKASSSAAKRDYGF
ncbi:serine/threonine protein kinase [Pendulispora albinea]|uniref:non-specific serine/threonine protein kinase n=2 Tax=Pendulispora albinea TaxID=2741071 RepID=A0ABZ2LMB4_9BACT